MTESSQSWQLLIYRVPQDPPGRRTYVWRHLKQLGAVYLQQAAVILPDHPDTRGALAELAQRIRAMGGDVSLLLTSSPDREWEQDIIRRFKEARDEEYTELIEGVERLEDEIRREQHKGKYTFAELEDIESDWEKLQRWQDRIQARDFFEAPLRASAHAAVERGREALDAFAGEVYRREQGGEGNRDGSG